MDEAACVSAQLRPGGAVRMLLAANRRSPRRHPRYLLGRLDQREARGVTTDPARRVITVGSGNPAYPANEAVKPGDLVALGQVIWIGRRI